jgi:uncharacterized protein
MADWSKILSRGNVEDRRGLGPMAGGVGGLGLLGVVAVIAFNLLSGGSIDPALVNETLDQLNQRQSSGRSSSLQPEVFQGADDYEVFASTVLGSNNDLWRSIFEQSNRNYTEPKLVLFRDGTSSGCGGASSQIGPHYCPVDGTIYIDETFFDVLQQQFGAQGGDVAEAYVIAHEVGHHVQQQLGITGQVSRQQQSNPDQANELSVQLELQADCLAGVWANSVADLGVFGPGEINEAIDAASAVGDDRIQQKTQGQINPETWTHGSAEQRVSWFNRGFDSGNPAQCQI